MKAYPHRTRNSPSSINTHVRSALYFGPSEPSLHGSLGLGIPRSKQLLALLQLIESSTEPGHLKCLGMSLLAFKSARKSAVDVSHKLWEHRS
jgi:hypothetical protein